MKIVVLSIVFAFVCLPLALAQTGPAPAPKSPSDTTAKDVTKGHKGLTDKIMGIVGPAESSQLTEKKRFDLYVVSVVGPVPILAEVVGAGFGQWENSPKEWGQGWSAFGERAGSNLAYNGIRGTITYGTSVWFREDNRYFSSHRSGLRARTGYAVLCTVTARHPDGSRAFSVSGVAGVLGASALSSIWGPRSWEGVRGIGRNASISFSITAGFNIVREFLPDVVHRLKR